MTHSRAAITSLLREIDRRPRQSLGQNFVADPNTVRRIARLAEVGPGDQVVEIGAGLGSLTLALAETGATVTAVEIDGDLIPILRRFVEPVGVQVVHADAMGVDWNTLLGDHERWHLVANLPYNIATPLVADLLDDVPRIATMLVMVQREAAERLVAQPGTAAYGIPSVKVAYWATGRIVGHVPATVFVPPPRVESSLVRLVRRDVPATPAEPSVLFALVRAGFGQRRKMLRRSLAGLATTDQLVAAGVAPDARAEQLSIDDWGRLALVVSRDRTG